MIGVMFKDSTVAAYAHRQFWQAIASTIGWTYSSLLCNYVKLYILLSLLVLAIIGYYLAEWLATKHKTQIKQEQTNNEEMM